MDEVTQQEPMSDYYRIENINLFGAMLRTKRIEAGMSTQDLMDAYELRTSVLNRIEHSTQKVFQTVVIDRLRKLTDDLGLTDKLVTTRLTERQWYDHCYGPASKMKNRRKSSAEKKRQVQQELAERRRQERKEREQEEKEERRAREFVYVPPPPPQTPRAPPPETFPDLNDQMGQIKLFIRLNTKGIMSDAALVVALRDLLRGGAK